MSDFCDGWCDDPTTESGPVPEGTCVDEGHGSHAVYGPVSFGLNRRAHFYGNCVCECHDI